MALLLCANPLFARSLTGQTTVFKPKTSLAFFKYF